MRLAGPRPGQGLSADPPRSVGSTNDEALSCARAGDPGGLWIVAEAQSRGRGPQRAGLDLARRQSLREPPPRRSGAAASAPPSSASSPASRSPAALREILAGDRRLAIKWPNDILFAGAKLAGILLESTDLPDGRFACVAGFGVNCASHPSDTLYAATDLGAILGRRGRARDRVRASRRAMAHWLDVWGGGAGFRGDPRANGWRLAGGLGSPIKVVRPSATMRRRLRDDRRDRAGSCSTTASRPDGDRGRRRFSRSRGRAKPIAARPMSAAVSRAAEQAMTDDHDEISTNSSSFRSAASARSA